MNRPFIPEYAMLLALAALIAIGSGQLIASTASAALTQAARVIQ